MNSRGFQPTEQAKGPEGAVQGRSSLLCDPFQGRFFQSIFRGLKPTAICIQPPSGLLLRFDVAFCSATVFRYASLGCIVLPTCSSRFFLADSAHDRTRYHRQCDCRAFQFLYSGPRTTYPRPRVHGTGDVCARIPSLVRFPGMDHPHLVHCGRRAFPRSTMVSADVKPAALLT